ncbi:hypothetical protein GCM10010289_84360 [Streptomyces violascens]|nr:hypothetical protein GCM10010289_84360 [Streptomyces violascens]
MFPEGVPVVMRAKMSIAALAVGSVLIAGAGASAADDGFTGPAQSHGNMVRHDPGRLPHDRCGGNWFDLGVFKGTSVSSCPEA